MIDFLVGLRQYIVYLFIGLFILAFISFMLLLKPKYRKLGLIGFALPFLIGFFLVGLNGIISIAMRAEISNSAELALNNNSVVLINGLETMVDSEQLLSDLSKINGWYFPNKTHPKDKFLVSIISENDTLEILLRRDSGNPQRYWTYLPKYDYELKLAMLKTKALNGQTGYD